MTNRFFSGRGEAHSAALLPQAGLQVMQRVARSTVLTYHELSPHPPAYRYGLSCHDFEEHVRLVAQLQGSSGYKAPLVLCFDDGHISNYTHALPVLQKYACKAIFFVIASRIGESSDFMTWPQLKELIALGHRVEAHGWSHVFLTRCSDAELRIEVSQSKAVLEDKLGVPVEALSAPHGRWNRRVVRACSEAGYRSLYTSTPWAAPRTIDQVEVIGRLMVIRSMDSAQLLNWLTMGRVETGLRRTQHALKQSAQYLLGNRLYHQLWTWYSGWKGPDDTCLRITNEGSSTHQQ
jgi:peptidoglycan/xylan/chitin deacetylase (PgdA/CDA1 family)